MYSSNLICDIITYINNNINKEITITELANIFFYDKTYIMKKFKKEIGISINNYINSIRIYNSLTFFTYNNYILSIAFNNGFQSTEYYSEIFKKYIGVSPRKYKYFISYSNKLNLTDEKIIRKSLLDLTLLKNKIDAYLTNRKPSGKLVKKISLK